MLKLEEFPIIHTNIWDAVITVPLVVILTQIIKRLFPIRSYNVPNVANVIGLAVSIFFAHRKDIWAGLFMGFFYGNAAVGLYATLKIQINAFRNKKTNRVTPIFFKGEKSILPPLIYSN